MTSEDNAVVKVNREIIPRIIGREGSTITKLEKKLGVHLTVEPSSLETGKNVRFELNETRGNLDLTFHKKLVGKLANIYVEDSFILSATIGKKTRIRVAKNSDVGKALLKALIEKKEITVTI